jgi:nucleotide-binding universal stress UspA family protein
MYDKILVPTDGSKGAEIATPHAVDIAKRYGAELHVIFVVDTDAVDLSLGSEQVQRIREGRFGEMDELKKMAEESTARIADHARAEGLQVVEAIVAGIPHKKIVKYAAEHGIKLIVMACHGRSGVSRVLLGSVTERVVRKAHVPVLVVDMDHE